MLHKIDIDILIQLSAGAILSSTIQGEQIMIAPFYDTMEYPNRTFNRAEILSVAHPTGSPTERKPLSTKRRDQKKKANRLKKKARRASR